MASIAYADPIMSHGSSCASSYSHRDQPLKGILKMPKEQSPQQQQKGQCELSIAANCEYN